MKRIYLFLFLLPYLLFAFEIADYQVEMSLDEDETIYIKEKVEVDFGKEQWHGIERFIPYKYKRDMHNYKLRIYIASIKDEAGKSLKYKTYKKDGNLVLRIGDADKYVSGTEYYYIDYQVRRAINYFDDKAELYWNVTGNDWRIPIRKASATVRFPASVDDADDIQAKCFTGGFGQAETDCDIEYLRNDEIRISTGRIMPGEGLTFAAQIPKYHMEPPSKGQRIAWFLQDNIDVIFGVLIPIIVFIFMLMTWLKKGRDPLDVHSVMVRYEPPDELNPAQAGSLYDETVDMRDITSTIVDLAVRGYLRIEEVESDKFLFFKNKDYRIVQLKEYDDLKGYEMTMLNALFRLGHTYNPTGDNTHLKSVLISELKNKFYKDLTSIKSSIESSLVDAGCFDEAPQNVIKKYVLFGIIGFSLAIISVVILHSIALMVGFLLSALIIIIFSKFMPAKTRKGATLARHILGFKEFVGRVEKDRIERMAKEDPTVFDRLLPYAMALGVEDHWANAFSDLYRDPPNWYRGRATGSAFTTAILVNSLGGAMNSMGNSMSSAPRGSSAGSGGSGFSGGGFSGGGFGGGGGGGW
ncbi:MAG: DUF2207 domain-containing protein [Candidatus Zixiibacteriota bacterium]